MYFDSLQALLNMDGHGVYVWSAYLVTSVTIVLVIMAPLRRKKRILRQLAGESRRTQGAAAAQRSGEVG